MLHMQAVENKKCYTKETERMKADHFINSTFKLCISYFYFKLAYFQLEKHVNEQFIWDGDYT